MDLLSAISTGQLVSLLVWVAVGCVVVWGVRALLAWAKIEVPQPVVILFWCLVAIGLILLIARTFGVLV